MGFGKFLGDLALAGIGHTGLGAAASLLGKGAQWIGSKISNNAGMIGKHLRKYAKDTMPKYDRYVWSNAADFAINHMPNGNVKDTLSKINDAAQGRTHPQRTVNKPSSTNTSGDYTFMKPSRAERIHNWNNPTHESKRPKEEIIGNG